MSLQDIDRAKPVSIRFTDAERQRLTREAGSRPLGTYIREKLLGAADTPRSPVRAPARDAELLGRILGQLGQSEIAASLNRLAQAATNGSLPVTPEVEDEIRCACAAMLDLRVQLLRALGVTVYEQLITPPAAGAFRRAARGTKP